MAEVIARALDLRAAIDKLCNQEKKKKKGRRTKTVTPLKAYALNGDEWLILVQLSPILSVSLACSIVFIRTDLPSL